MSDTFVFIKLFWKTEPYQSFIQFNKLGSKEIISRKLNIGEEINVSFGEHNYCVGTEVYQGSYLSCIENHQRNLRESDMQKMISNKYNKCSLCRTSSFFECRKICTGDICNPSSLLAKSMCEPPNTSVYLTHVGGELKVGVSLNLRRRWIEQGSDLAVEIAKLPGLEARRVEQIAGKKLGLKLQVRNSKKLQALAKPTEAMIQQMQDTFDQLQLITLDILQESDGSFNYKMDLHQFNDVYGSLSDDRHIEFIAPVPNAEFGGKIVQIKGSVIVVEQGPYYYALDTKRLISHSFQFLQRAANVEGQASLKEWF